MSFSTASNLSSKKRQYGSVYAHTSFEIDIVRFELGSELWIREFLDVKGRFLKFRRYHNFANLFSKLSETTFYK